jgi:hypothetical protein
MKMAAESHEKEQRPAYTFAMMGSLTIDEDLVKKKKMKTNMSTTTTYSKTKKNNRKHKNVQFKQF